MTKRERPISGLEMLGSQKARRAIAQRLAESVGYCLGGLGTTMSVTIPDGPADPKTGMMNFSTYTYIAWTNLLNTLAIEDQEKIVIAHLEKAITTLQGQLDQYRAEFEVAAKARAAEAAASEAVKSSEPCVGCPPKPEVPS